MYIVVVCPRRFPSSRDILFSVFPPRSFSLSPAWLPRVCLPAMENAPRRSLRSRVSETPPISTATPSAGHSTAMPSAGAPTATPPAGATIPMPSSGPSHGPKSEPGAPPGPESQAECAVPSHIPKPETCGSQPTLPAHSRHRLTPQCSPTTVRRKNRKKGEWREGQRKKERYKRAKKKTRRYNAHSSLCERHLRQHNRLRYQGHFCKLTAL